jgi:ABC-type dipeptide/oligopeptide/nickel transport system permease component
MIQGVVLLYASVIILLSLLVDLSYGWLDPRIRYH